MVVCQIGHLEVVNMLIDTSEPSAQEPFVQDGPGSAKENGRVGVAEYLNRRLKTR